MGSAQLGGWGRTTTSKDQVGVITWRRSTFVGRPGVDAVSASTRRVSAQSCSSCWCGRRSLLTSLPFPPTKARATALKLRRNCCHSERRRREFLYRANFRQAIRMQIVAEFCRKIVDFFVYRLLYSISITTFHRWLTLRCNKMIDILFRLLRFFWTC